ncbi:hypothetical protein OS493_027060 [Desmophyllum pertusum]|uniref:TNFR-Cys domain-containing protein n=1 Tax=Desmophyllum pertusum TaxID=174260 RepID=A0A9X0CD42_9CNID|nr:hypothetical protein OS493_027060 [Desmophyllum pertusum]
MEICQIVNYVLICFVVNQELNAQACQDDQHTVKLPDGNVTCMDCRTCPPGSGATTTCGSTVPYNAISVECKECTPEHYSDSFSSEICKPCSKCMPDEVIVAKCTKLSDTRCSCKPCPKGYYRNHTMSKCLPCSGCCLGAGVDVVVPQCVSQGMPHAQICSYHKRKPCMAKCWYDEITVVKHDGKNSCLPCPVCSNDFGLTKPCGCFIHDHDVLPKCERPTLGKTFVNQQGILKSCKICSTGQEVVVNCSANSDTICGGCKKKDCGSKEASSNITNLETLESQTATSDTKKVEAEYPIQHNPGHVVFEKTGVEVLTLDSSKPTLQDVPGDLALQAISDCLDMPGFLDDGELPLSPTIKFICSKLDGPLEVQIPHGANMVLSSKKWKVILKEFLNNKWVVVNDVEGKGIKEFVPKSNHVRFETDHLSTFAVVGYADKHSLSLFKRMKVMAFCSETRAGEDLVVRVYCFDDCEWSFERLMTKERKEGGKLMSSIESLDFSVTCEEDVEFLLRILMAGS